MAVTRVSANCCGSGEGGGDSGGGGGVSLSHAPEESGLDLAAEVLILEWNVNLADAPVGTIQARLSGLFKVASGVGSSGLYQLRVGGTIGAIDGTVRASVTSISTAYEQLTNAGAAFANPAAQTLVKLTTTNTVARSFLRGVQIMFV